MGAYRGHQPGSNHRLKRNLRFSTFHGQIFHLQGYRMTPGSIKSIQAGRGNYAWPLSRTLKIEWACLARNLLSWIPTLRQQVTHRASLKCTHSARLWLGQSVGAAVCLTRTPSPWWSTAAWISCVWTSTATARHRRRPAPSTTRRFSPSWNTACPGITRGRTPSSSAASTALTCCWLARRWCWPSRTTAPPSRRNTCCPSSPASCCCSSFGWCGTSWRGRGRRTRGRRRTCTPPHAG